MTSMTVEPVEQVTGRRLIVGVDTHKYVHVAVAIDHLGSRIAAQHVGANREGYAQLEAWAASLAGNGRVIAFGVEGTGSYGVGLAPRQPLVQCLAVRPSRSRSPPTAPPR